MRLIFNMDECMVEAGEGRNSAQVFVPRDWSAAIRRSPPDLGMHITLIMAICADGTSVKTTAILPLKTFPMDCWSVLDAFNWTGQKSDWINRKILEDWVELVFLPHVNDKREKLDHWSEAALLWIPREHQGDRHAGRQ